MKKLKPLDDLEMFELLQAAYPEKFKDDSDSSFESAQIFADELSGWDEIADLLGRVVMLTMPMESGITKRLSHCIGKINIQDGNAYMIAAVRRDALSATLSADEILNKDKSTQDVDLIGVNDGARTHDNRNHN
jgi:hypothetical protein